MLPYWLLFSCFASGAMLYRSEPHRQIRGGPYFLAFCVAAALMIGFRYDVGGDWLNYLEMMHMSSYLTLGQMLNVGNQDPAYAFLNFVATRAGFGIWFVNMICAAVFIWGVTAFARRQPNPWLVVVVAVPYLIIVVGMAYTRQAAAMGLVLVGLATLDRGIIRFLAYLGAAAAFHKSAVLVLPLVMLSTEQRRSTTIAIGIVSAILFYYLFLRANVDRMVNNYVEQGYASQGAGVRVAMNVPPALIFLLFRNRFAVGDEARLWRNFSLAALAALIILFFTEATAAVDRIALYLIPLQMFVLGRLPAAFPERQRPSFTLTATVVLYSATIQYVWLNYAVNAEFWLPYRAFGFVDEI